VAGRSQDVVLSFLYWSLRRLLELAVLRRRSEREKEIEILLLRHQLRMLERQVARPQLTPANRALLAAFSGVLPRARGVHKLDRVANPLDLQGDRISAPPTPLVAQTSSGRLAQPCGGGAASRQKVPANDPPFEDFVAERGCDRLGLSRRRSRIRVPSHS
jgi:hypothetical protein